VSAYQLENGAIAIQVERWSPTGYGCPWTVTHSRTIQPGAWAPAPAVTPEAVAAAATWAVNMENDTERRRLMQGHRARRIPVERAGLPATDYTAADKWLVLEHAAAPKTEG
jgi:hypothetical protein